MIVDKKSEPKSKQMASLFTFDKRSSYDSPPLGTGGSKPTSKNRASNFGNSIGVPGGEGSGSGPNEVVAERGSLFAMMNDIGNIKRNTPSKLRTSGLGFASMAGSSKNKGSSKSIDSPGSSGIKRELPPKRTTPAFDTY